MLWLMNGRSRLRNLHRQETDWCLHDAILRLVYFCRKLFYQRMFLLYPGLLEFLFDLCWGLRGCQFCRDFDMSKHGQHHGNTLLVVVHPGLVHLFARGHWWKARFPCKQEKHTLFSAENFACCIGFFSINTEHFHKRVPQDGYPNFFATVVVDAKFLLQP